MNKRFNDMRNFTLFASLVILTACGSGTPNPVGNPEFSFAGLDYDLAFNGPGRGFSPEFSGMDETANMPTTDTANFTGIVRGSLDLENYRSGSSQMDVDFAASTAEIKIDVDMTGVTATSGRINITETATISGNEFEFNSSSAGPLLPTSIRGHFYGDGASTAGGLVDIGISDSDTFSGAFIVAQ